MPLRFNRSAGAFLYPMFSLFCSFAIPSRAVASEAVDGMDDSGEAVFSVNEETGETAEGNSNDSDAYNSRGAIYGNLKQYEKALRDFEKAYELNPNNKQAKGNIELCRKALGK